MSLSKSIRRLIKNETKAAENCFVNPRFLTPTELSFVHRARGNGAIVHRPSWPDFIVRFKDEWIGIEVKMPGDRVSRNQRRTFNLLEDNGLMKIFIWYSGTPDKLIPWKKAKNPLHAAHVDQST